MPPPGTVPKRRGSGEGCVTGLFGGVAALAVGIAIVAVVSSVGEDKPDGGDQPPPPAEQEGSAPTEGTFQEQVRAAIAQAGIPEHSSDADDWFRPLGDEGTVRDHFDQGASRHENPEVGLVASACGAVANPHNEGLIEAGVSGSQEEWHDKIVVRIAEGDNDNAGPACVDLVLNGLRNSPDNVQLHYGS